MRPLRRLLMVVAVAALAATGCSSGKGTGGGSAVATTTPTVTQATAAASATTTPAAPDTHAWSSNPVARDRSGTAQAQLVHVRIAHHPGYDRVTFEFSGSLPGYRVQYVPQVTQDASGAPVPLQGQAFLSVVLTPANAHDDMGAPTYHGPKDVTTGYASLKEVAMAGDFEGHLSFGLGLHDRVGFRVVELANPTRVAVDVAG